MNGWTFKSARCTAEDLPAEGSVAALSTHPQNSVIILLFHSEEVAVVLPQDDGGGARGVVDQGELPEVIALVESAHHTLRSVVRLLGSGGVAV